MKQSEHSEQWGLIKNSKIVLPEVVNFWHLDLSFQGKIEKRFFWFCFRAFLNSMDYFSYCTSNTSLQKALEAYTNFLSTTVPGAEESCCNPCQFSLVRPKTYFTMPFVPSSCMETREYPVTLRIPATILLTKSTFSYPFMTFAADLGGKTKKISGLLIIIFTKDIIC